MYSDDKPWGSAIAVVLLSIPASIVTFRFLDAIALSGLWRSILNGFVISGIFVATVGYTNWRQRRLRNIVGKGNQFPTNRVEVH